MLKFNEMNALASLQSVCLFWDGSERHNSHVVSDIQSVSELGFDGVK